MRSSISVGSAEGVPAEIAATGRTDGTRPLRGPCSMRRPVPRGLVGVIQDITERRDSEVRLRRSEELLRATTANTADTLMLVDTDLQVRFINKSVGGMSIEQIIGREIDVLLPEPARERRDGQAAAYPDTGETATYEFESSRRRCRCGISRIARCWCATMASAPAFRSRRATSPSASAWSRKSSMSRAASGRASAAICTMAWDRS